MGLTPEQIQTRLEKGALLSVHRGVYRVGHSAPSTLASYLAAVRACGDSAVLSGLAAAHLWGIVRGPRPPPEVTAPTQRRVAGVACRRCRNLSRQDTGLWRGIPVTSLARTMIDLSPLLTQPDLARAFHEASVRHRLAPEQVEAALARRPNVPGARALRAVLRGDVPVTLSTLESRFLALLHRHSLPLPGTNTRFGKRRLDCRWPDRGLVVELDSYLAHRTRHAWEEDRRRERLVRAAGLEFRRYTWDDVVSSPGMMLRELQLLLTDPGPG